MRRDVGAFLRRVVRRTLKGRLQAHTIYTPQLGERKFLGFLYSQGLLKSSPGDFEDAASRSAIGRDVAYEFRQTIGERFFLCADEVDAAIVQLGLLIPTWRSDLEAFVDDCRRIGLPIYNAIGAKLDDEFFWRMVPPGPGNDLLFPFRPHRFAFLPRLTMAVHEGLLSADIVQRLVDGWVREAVGGKNPFCYGSNLVVIQRLLATCWAWLFLAARPPVHTADGLGLEASLLRILWDDAQFLKTRLGDSVPNNHLLADRFIGFFLYTVLPEFMNSRGEATEQEFRDEFLRQTYEDGGSFEHSTHYHEFACEMGVAYLLICRRVGRTPDSELERRIEALLIFQMRVTGTDATPLLLGNATEDSLFPLDSEGGWCAGSLREVYRGLFDTNFAPAPASDPTKERAFWMLGGHIDSHQGIDRRDWLPSFMPDAGFHVFPDRRTRSRLIFRSGPGEKVAVAAGHMHADLMSIYLIRHERPVLVDAGTLTYRWAFKSSNEDLPPWRSYFAGSSAHNALSISGVDPLGDFKGDFRPFDTTARVQSRSYFNDGIAWTEARLENAGPYSDYVRGCVHVEGRYWVIYDGVPESSDTSRQRWLGFQFAPEIRLDVHSGRVLASFQDDDAATLMLSTREERPQVLAGSLNPVGGWVSTRYGEIAPAPQLRYPVGARQHLCAFVIADAHNAPRSVKILPLGSGLLGVRIETSVGHDLLAINSSLALESTREPSDLSFDGAVLWLNFDQSRLSATRWIHGSTAIWPSKDIHLALGGAGPKPI